MGAIVPLFGGQEPHHSAPALHFFLEEMLHVYGHDQVVAELKKSRYNTILLEGDPHIGKFTLAVEVAKYHGYPIQYRAYELSPSNARTLTQFATYRPSQAFIVDLSGASEQVQNILLKTLEAPSPESMYILVSSTPVLETVRSRMQAIFKMGRLSPDDVMQVLRDRGVPKDALSDAGRLSDGTLKKPLDNLAEQKNTIVRALKAIYDHDATALSRQSAHWDDHTTELLKTWCVESITEQWKIFSPEDSLFSGSKVPLAILLAVSKNIRPKLVVRSSLMGLI